MLPLLLLYCCGCLVGIMGTGLFLFPAGDGFGFGVGSTFGDGGFIPTRRDGPPAPDLPPSCLAFFGMLVAAMVYRRSIVPTVVCLEISFHET